MTHAPRVTSARVVPLGSAEAGQPPKPATPGEGVALVLELSALAWQRSGKPLPSYQRHEMPIRVIPLRLK